jgi:hypothetical protein
MRNSEPGAGHSKSEAVVPAGVQPVVARRGLTFLRRCSVDRQPRRGILGKYRDFPESRLIAGKPD